jgi:protein-S-isoprenylcysteine O-methyltransferase Ste14
VARLSPDTLKERARFASVGGVQPGDRALVLIVAMIGPMTVLLVAGLDHRFGWSGPVAAWVQAAAVGCALAGAAIATWAMAANPFFSAVARIQADRGHRVISAGPYRWVRHPGYSSSILATFAIPLLLASLWGLVPAALTALAIIIRTAREDRMLRHGLRGYEAYAATTRWRLVPGIW